MIESTRTLVRADGTRTTIRTLVPQTAADVQEIAALAAAGLAVLGTPRPSPPPKRRTRRKRRRKW